MYLDAGIELVETFEMRKQIELECHITGSDPDLAGFQVHQSGKLLFAHGDCLVSFGYMFVEKFACTCQGYTFFRPDEQVDTDCLF